MLADRARIDEEFRKAWLPYFCRSGQRNTSLEEFNREVEGWLPLFTGGRLAPVDWSDAGRCCSTYGCKLLVVSIDGGGGSSRSCQSLGMMSWHVFSPRLKMLEFGPMGCWMPTLQ